MSDLTGQRFGRLVVVEKLPCRKYRRPYWRCKCDCGKMQDVLAPQLISGYTRSCGCLKRESDRKKCKRLTKNGTNEAMLKQTAPRSNNKTGVRGVCFVKSKNKYKAHLCVRGVTVYAKFFDTLEEAARARAAAVEKFVGVDKGVDKNVDQNVDQNKK